MLKVALIALVILSVAVILYLVTMSFKLLRQTEKQQVTDKNQHPEKEVRLHPKFKDKK